MRTGYRGEYISRSIGSDSDLGIIKVKNDEDNPYRYFAQKDYEELRDIARAAQKWCGRISRYDTSENNRTVYITVDQATSLLNNCELDNFWYNGDYKAAWWGTPDGIPTGIVLAYKDDPQRIHVEPNLIDTMLPVARQVTNKCHYLEINPQEQ